MLEKCSVFEISVKFFPPCDRIGGYRDKEFCQHAQFYFAERRGLSWFSCWKSHHEDAEKNSTAYERLIHAVYRFLHVLQYQHINYTLEWN